jgi:PQQ-dependent dehydrogenase (s-GDH family)
MRKFITSFLILLTFCLQVAAQNKKRFERETFAVRIVAGNLSDPWEVTYGPDSLLWVTESKAYRVLRIDPKDGRKTVLLDLSSSRNFPRYDTIPDEKDGGKAMPQGLMGIALHPDLLRGKPFVYLAYLYRFSGAEASGNGCLDKEGGCFFSTRVVRYTYLPREQKLVNPQIICDTIPGSNDHNGGRLLIAPINGNQYLFYSTGDMGAGQFINGGRKNHAQSTESYEGKILRFNLEPGPDTKWIPADNPFSTAVYSYGHRNPQGLAYAEIAGKPRIYSCEHGPFSDDEINIIEKGKNYGHPLIIGYKDGNYNGLAAGVSAHIYIPGKWHTTYPEIVDEKANAKRIGMNYRDPVKSFCVSTNHFLTTLLTGIRNDEPGKHEWPAEAPSSIDVYTSDAIPGWKNSLLITTLKGGKLIRLPLTADGAGVTGDTICYFKAPVRYRDIAISADGKKIYLALDSTAVTSGPSAENPKAINYRGVILEYTYQPGKGSDTQGGRTATTTRAVARLPEQNGE